MPWQKGQSGNPGGRRKKTDEEREVERIMATKLTMLACEKLEKLLQSKNEHIVAKAVAMVYERGQVGAPEDPLPDNHNEWTMAQCKRVRDWAIEAIASKQAALDASEAVH